MIEAGVPGVASVGLSGLTRGALVALDNGLPFGELRFSYNPTEVATSKAATWHRPTTNSAESATSPEFTGAQPQTVDMELFFDAWSDPAGDVSTEVNKLLSWTRPTPASRSRRLPSPPVVTFRWGTSRALADFKGYVKSVNARYTMFRLDGTPIRATCKVTLEEVPSEPAGQNPTSGSLDSRRGRVLGDGDSLASVAYQEYGEAALWRALAQFNGIDDPFGVASGTRLLVPSIAEARRLATRPGARPGS